MRAHCVAFPISTRNSAAAVAHLISQTGVSHILVGHEQAMQDLVERSLEALRTRHGDTPRVALSPMPTFEELYSDKGLNTTEDIPWTPQGPDTPSLILHSSGEVYSRGCPPLLNVKLQDRRHFRSPSHILSDVCSKSHELLAMVTVTSPVK